jgi:hypothetical protein
LPHHPNVVSHGIVFNDLGVLYSIPAHVLHLESFARRWNTDAHAAIDWIFPDTFMRASHPLAQDDDVAFRRSFPEFRSSSQGTWFGYLRGLTLASLG